MFNMSAAMAGEFVNAATTMTEQIAALGPNPLRLSSSSVVNDAEGGEEKL
jgi:hypothetical protein